jgi:type IV pilus assembly protein PilE
MKTQKKGFTLVELVIAIVIIGILSIVSVPMYQLHVEKARVAEAIANLRAIADANTHYYLEHGTWCTDIRELPISIEGEVYKKDNRWRIETRNYVYAACTGSEAGSTVDTIATANRVPYKTRYYLSIKTITGRDGNNGGNPYIGNYGIYGGTNSSKYKLDKQIVEYYHAKFPRVGGEYTRT